MARDKYGCSNCNGDGCSECMIEVDAPPCAWWLNCANDAETVEPHPILGDVPICRRCFDKLRKIEAARE